MSAKRALQSKKRKALEEEQRKAELNALIDRHVEVMARALQFPKELLAPVSNG